ncbi:MAG: S24/S26 family peptidase [Bacteroidales bacterium]|jgi:hypothetical protein
MKAIDNFIALEIIEESLKEGVSVKLTVRGNSMFPTLEEGKDVVSLVPFTQELSLCVGDVVLYRYRKGFILHRVIEIPNNEIVFLKGDSLTSIEKVKRSDILAVANYKRHSPIVLFVRRIRGILSPMLSWPNIDNEAFTRK